MGNPVPPDGWDEEISPEEMDGPRALRKMFVEMIAAGFSSDEATTIIAKILAFGANATPPSTGG